MKLREEIRKIEFKIGENGFWDEYEDDFVALFQKYALEMVGEDDNIISITHRVENVRNGYNIAKAEIRERIKSLSK